MQYSACHAKGKLRKGNPLRKDAMNTQSDIKLTDQLERDLIDRELGTQSRGLPTT